MGRTRRTAHLHQDESSSSSDSDDTPESIASTRYQLRSEIHVPNPRDFESPRGNPIPTVQNNRKRKVQQDARVDINSKRRPKTREARIKDLEAELRDLRSALHPGELQREQSVLFVPPDDSPSTSNGPAGLPFPNYGAVIQSAGLFGLPPVPPELFAQLRDWSCHINLVDLLIDNRALKSSGKKQQRNIHDEIQTFSRWFQAYYVFMMYRSHFYPAMTRSLICYANVIASFFERGHRVSEIINYDAQFRLHATALPGNKEIWCVADFSTSQCTIGPPLVSSDVVANSAAVVPPESTGYRCYKCGSPHHLQPSCPKKDTILGQPFRLRPAVTSGGNQMGQPKSNGTRKHCVSFSEGLCSRIPCPAGEHICSFCQRKHRKTDCNILAKYLSDESRDSNGGSNSSKA